MRTRRTREIFPWIAALAGMALAPLAPAATCNTTGTTTNWSDQRTWGPAGVGCVGAPGGLPGSADTANINHNVTVNSARTVGVVNVNAGTLTQTSALTLSTATLTGTLNVAGGTLTSSNTLTVNGPTNVTAGLLNFNLSTNARIFAQTVTVSGTGSWTNTGNRQVQFRGGIDHTGTGTFDNGTNTTTFNVNTPQTISGDADIRFRGAVTVSAGIVIDRTNTATVTISGNLQGGSGASAWNNDAGRLDYGGANTPMATGVLNANNASNTVNYGRAGNQAVEGTTYRTLELGGDLLGVAGSGTKTANGAITVNGDLTLDGSATFTAGTFTHNLNGSFNINTSAGAPLSTAGVSHFHFNAPFTGAAATSMGGTTGSTIAFADVTINNPSGVAFNDNASFSAGTTPTLTVSAGATLTPAAAVVVSGTGTLTGSGTVQVTRTAATPNFTTQYTIATKTLLNGGGAGNHLTVDYSGAGAQTVNSLAYGHLKLSGSGTKTMPAGALSVTGNFTMADTAQATAAGDMTVGGNFDIGAGTTFSASTFTHAVAGNFVRSGTFNDDTSTFDFNGAAAQAITGTVTFNNLTVSNTIAPVTPDSNITVNANVSNAGTLGGTIVLGGGSAAHQLSGTGVYNNLTLNDAQGAQLIASPTVNGTLTLTSGILTTGSINTLNIGAAGTAAGASNTSHVVGNLAKAFSAAGTFTYDVGDGTRHSPAAITFTALPTTGSLTVSVPTPAADHPDTTAAISSVDPDRSVNRYWTLKNATLVGTFDAAFNYPASDLDAGTTAANMVIARGATCSGSGGSRSCSNTWSRPTLGGAPTSTQATAIGMATSLVESDFVIGEAYVARFSREKEFIFTRELY